MARSPISFISIGNISLPQTTAKSEPACLLPIVELANGNADTLNLINNQQLYIGAVWEDQVMTFLGNRQLPESFRLTLLEKGQVGSGDAMFVRANAKHAAAAMLLIDMAINHDFQVWKLEIEASRSSVSTCPTT